MASIWILPFLHACAADSAGLTWPDAATIRPYVVSLTQLFFCSGAVYGTIAMLMTKNMGVDRGRLEDRAASLVEGLRRGIPIGGVARLAVTALEGIYGLTITSRMIASTMISTAACSVLCACLYLPAVSYRGEKLAIERTADPELFGMSQTDSGQREIDAFLERGCFPATEGVCADDDYVRSDARAVAYRNRILGARQEMERRIISSEHAKYLLTLSLFEGTALEPGARWLWIFPILLYCLVSDFSVATISLRCARAVATVQTGVIAPFLVCLVAVSFLVPSYFLSLSLMSTLSQRDPSVFEVVVLAIPVGLGAVMLGGFLAVEATRERSLWGCLSLVSGLFLVLFGMSVAWESAGRLSGALTLGMNSLSDPFANFLALLVTSLPSVVVALCVIIGAAVRVGGYPATMFLWLQAAFMREEGGSSNIAVVVGLLAFLTSVLLLVVVGP